MPPKLQSFDMKKVIDPPSAQRIIAKARPTRVRRILVTTDFSRPSLRAIPYALAVSRHFGAEVHLLHVVDTTQHSSKSLMLPLSSPAELSRPLLNRLQAIASKFQEAQKIHVMKLREGHAYNEICAAAQKLRADLIVIATHGYTGFKHAFLGSTAERVVQHSPRPVLVVRQQAKRFNERRMHLRKILAPIDFSLCSELAFHCAVGLACEFQAQLQLVHVIHPHPYPFEDEHTALDATRLMRDARNSAKEEMRDIAARANARISVQVREGSPATEICSAASKGIDLIVTSTHGRTGLSHVLIGSVAEHVVRYASCPVLVIPVRAKF